MKTMSTMERLKLHMDQNGKDYYKNIIAESKQILTEKHARDEIREARLQVAASVEEGCNLVRS